MDTVELAPMEIRCGARGEHVVIEIRPPESDEWHELLIDPGLASQLVLSLHRAIEEIVTSSSSSSSS